MTLTDAVIPCAGLGTRFLPLTKSVPKELLPLGDKPCLQYVIDEAMACGITNIILVISPEKRLIEHYYSPNPHLEAWLAKRHQKEWLAQIQKLHTQVKINLAFQTEPLGLGHAVLCAEPYLKSDYFLVLLPDDIIEAEPSVSQQMIPVFELSQQPVLAVMSVAWDDVGRYGIVEATPLSTHLGSVIRIEEKPRRDEAPSNLAVIGRYILPKSIMTTLQNIAPGTGGEIQLTDALKTVLKQEGLLAHTFTGERYDTGTPLGLLKASVNVAMRHEKYGAEFRQFLKTCI